MYSSTLSLTWTVAGVGWLAPLPTAIPLGKKRYPLFRRLGGPQSRSERMQKTSPPPGLDPRTAQPIGSHYNDYTILVQYYIQIPCGKLREGVDL
jgi:hypothetical protein